MASHFQSILNIFFELKSPFRVDLFHRQYSWGPQEGFLSCPNLRM